MPRNISHKMRVARWSIATAASAALLTLSTAGVAEAAWTNKSGSGNAAAEATTLAAPGAPTIVKTACNNGNQKYTARFTFTGSTSAFASATYTVLYGTANGGPYGNTGGTGSSPITSTTNLFVPNTAYYVVVQAQAGSGWIANSTQVTMNFSCP